MGFLASTSVPGIQRWSSRARWTRATALAAFLLVPLGFSNAHAAAEAGDVIISGFQAWNSPSGQNAGEFVELFNTTGRAISLEGLELISRTDRSGGDGSLDVDWQLADESPLLTGLEIAPYSFFLIGESGVAGGADLIVNVDLATGEGGVTERAIGLQLRLDGVHMDHLLYGRHDGSDTGIDPPGDLAFDGNTYPRVEVIRNTKGTQDYREGVVRREGMENLYAGHDVDGHYTDEASLGGGSTAGVWSSPHDEMDGNYTPRSASTPALFPAGMRDLDYLAAFGEVLVAAGPDGADWRYHDGITQPSTAYPPDDGEGDQWFEPGYDDASWASGRGPFGYGDFDGMLPNTAFDNGQGGGACTKSRRCDITYLLRTTFTVGEIPAALTAAIMRDDGFILFLNGAEVARHNLTDPVNANTLTDGTVSGAEEATFFTFTLDPTLLAVGTNTLAVELHNRSTTSSDVGFDMHLVGGAPAEWHYFDGIVHPDPDYPADDALGNAWNEPGFDDQTWATGTGMVGYGSLDGVIPETSVTPGQVTYLLRAIFEVSSLPDMLTAEIVRDDGFILYLNGLEVARDNVGGLADAATLADSTVSGSGESEVLRFALDPVLLAPGTNTVAVELHNRGTTSSDVGFALSLVALGTFEEVVCGDGVVGFGESCDDGNAVDGDCCSATCQLDAAGTACGGDACVTDSCDVGGVCLAGAPLVCDNGLYCDGVESCDAALGCVAGASPTVDDGVACTLDTCDEGTDQVVHQVDDGACDNGLFCDGTESCHPAVGCLGDPFPPAVEDGVLCTNDYCDDLLDEIVNEVTPSCSYDDVMANVSEVPTLPGWGRLLMGGMLLACGAATAVRRR